MTSKRSMTVGVIGLGIMGTAYARNLLAAGYSVVGFDVAEGQLDALRKAGGAAAPSPSQVAQEADAILLALPSVPALREACLGADGVVQSTRDGQVIAEMSTLPLPVKEEVRAVLEAKGVAVLDCPVSGTGAQAAERDLVVFVSGDRAAGEKIKPVFEALGRDIRYVGAFGDGMKLKYVANLLVTIHNLAAAEALLLAEKAGLDLQMVYDAISAGAGTSRMFEVRGPMMVEGRYEPATMKMDVYMKDLQLIMEFARDIQCPTPLMAASLPYYVAGLSDGRAKEDTAAVFGVLRNLAGLEKD